MGLNPNLGLGSGGRTLSPEGAIQHSPGQRPGLQFSLNSKALKGRHKNARPTYEVLPFQDFLAGSNPPATSNGTNHKT